MIGRRLLLVIVLCCLINFIDAEAKPKAEPKAEPKAKASLLNIVKKTTTHFPNHFSAHVSTLNVDPKNTNFNSYAPYDPLYGYQNFLPGALPNLYTNNLPHYTELNNPLYFNRNVYPNYLQQILSGYEYPQNLLRYSLSPAGDAAWGFGDDVPFSPLPALAPLSHRNSLLGLHALTPYTNAYTNPYPNAYINPYINAYTNPNINAFTNPYINALTNPYINAYTNENINAFTNPHINALTNSYINAYPSLYTSPYINPYITHYTNPYTSLGAAAIANAASLAALHPDLDDHHALDRVKHNSKHLTEGTAALPLNSYAPSSSVTGTNGYIGFGPGKDSEYTKSKD